VVFAATEQENVSCSWLCATASEVLAAHVAGTVCIVDANRRLPSLHAHCGVENHLGLSDCVVNEGPITRFTQQVRDNLYLMPFGTNTPEWPTALTSPRMRTRIAELRESFDHVMFYAPPVGRFPDAMLLGQLADGIILIIEAENTKRQEATRAKETIESANVRLLGAVLDNRKFPIPEAIYRYL
jgi:Mrp family chromosome partitioning ATPase